MFETPGIRPRIARVTYSGSNSPDGLCLWLLQAPVVLTLDSAIQRINHYPADKYYGNQLRLPLDSDLSGGLRYPTFEQPRPVL